MAIHRVASHYFAMKEEVQYSSLNVFWDIKQMILIEIYGEKNKFNSKVYIATLQRLHRCM
jgi:hypothetical protein